MSNSAKIVLWMGFFMIAFGIVANWSTISATLFGSQTPGLLVPGPGGIPPNPATHKCPAGYISAYGKCWSPATNPIPPSGGGFT